MFCHSIILTNIIRFQVFQVTIFFVCILCCIRLCFYGVLSSVLLLFFFLCLLFVVLLFLPFLWGFSGRLNRLFTRSGASSLLHLGHNFGDNSPGLGLLFLWTKAGQGVLFECGIVNWASWEIVTGHVLLFILLLFLLFPLFSSLALFLSPSQSSLDQSDSIGEESGAD